MKTREEIMAILRQLKPEFQSQFKVTGLALFGSYARNEQRQGSDVDVLVDFDPSIGLKFVTMADQAEKAIGLPVHLVSRRALKPRAYEYIMHDLIHV
jgi:hypothetical protein